MMDKASLDQMAEYIQTMRNIAETLKEAGTGIQSIERNVTRILASIRLLEMNVSDIAKIA
ncbi:MAG: hypothetical protein ACOWYE_07905 [Desulfatiglandales bacterium]